MSGGSYRIFSIFGIDVELHWTLLLALVYVLIIMLFSSVSLEYALYLLIFLVVLFLSVLIHELMHSITGRRNGVNINKIILWPLGGMSVIEDINIDPGVEFNMSVVGPLSSLLIGSAAGALSVYSPPGIIAETMQLTFAINLILGVFNLLPAFPMDGGRALRAYLQRRRSLYDATTAAVRISKYILWVIILATLIFLVVPSSYSLGYKELTVFINLVVVFFLYGGANAEEESVRMRRETEGVKLSEAVSRKYLLVKPETSVRSMYQKIRRSGEYTVVTKADGKFAVVNLAGIEKMSGSTAVGSLSQQIPNIPVTANVIEAIYKIEASDYGVAAVVDRDKLLGITTLRQLRAMISLHMMSRRNR